MLVDDRRSTVSLPETPLLGVLPGTGGITRVTDKRKVRRDLRRLLLLDRRRPARRQGGGLAPGRRSRAASQMEGRGHGARAKELAAKRSDRPKDASGIKLDAAVSARSRRRCAPIRMSSVDDRSRARRRHADGTRRRPTRSRFDAEAAHELGDKFWPLRRARAGRRDPASARQRAGRSALLLLRTEGDAKAVLDHDDFLAKANGDWLMREVRHYLKRVFKRVDMTREKPLRADRARHLLCRHAGGARVRGRSFLMLIGAREGDNRPPAAIMLGEANFGFYPMGNGLTRLATRFLGEPQTSDARQGQDRRAARSGRSDAARPRHLQPTRISIGTTNCA